MVEASEPAPQIVLKTFPDCTPQEREAFCQFVIDGGEVKPAHVRAGVKVAERMAFALAGETLAGTGCLKNPNDGYRQDVFEKSGSKLDPDDFKYEVGYVVVHKDFRGQHLSTRIVGDLIGGIDGRLFATFHDHVDKYPMHAALRHHGFTQEGRAYESSDHKGKMLLLFVLDR